MISGKSTISSVHINFRGDPSLNIFSIYNIFSHFCKKLYKILDNVVYSANIELMFGVYITNSHLGELKSMPLILISEEKGEKMMKTIHTNVSQNNLVEKNINRDQIDLLRRRLDLLDGKDKLLMTLYLENGYSIFKISKVTDLCQSSIARRIKRLTKKLTEGRYITCLRNSDKFNRYQMVIAKDYFLKDLSMREIALKRCRSLYHIRETISKIKRILNECECNDTN